MTILTDQVISDMFEDGTATDFTWETGIKHDASNSRPEYSQVLRDLNARVRADMAAGQ